MTGIYTLTTAERYRALHALYTLWHSRSGDDYHAAMAADCWKRVEAGE